MTELAKLPLYLPIYVDTQRTNDWWPWSTHHNMQPDKYRTEVQNPHSDIAAASNPSNITGARCTNPSPKDPARRTHSPRSRLVKGAVGTKIHEGTAQQWIERQLTAFAFNFQSRRPLAHNKPIPQNLIPALTRLRTRLIDYPQIAVYWWARWNDPE